MVNKQIIQPKHVFTAEWGVVLRFDFGFLSSNAYAIIPDSYRAMLVDPGMVDAQALIRWFEAEGLSIAGVILTHEHADHCIAVNELYQSQEFIFFCSEDCLHNIACSRQNFSSYHETIDDFTIDIPAKVVIDSEYIVFSGISFQAILTPGHSPGGICVSMNNCLFTGDTILNGISSVTSQ